MPTSSSRPRAKRTIAQREREVETRASRASIVGQCGAEAAVSAPHSHRTPCMPRFSKGDKASTAPPAIKPHQPTCENTC